MHNHNAILISLPLSIFELSGEDQLFVADTLHNFCNEAVHKYIAGQKEHGGRIIDRPVISEAQNEVIDIMFYLAAAKKKYVNGQYPPLKKKS